MLASFGLFRCFRSAVFFAACIRFSPWLVFFFVLFFALKCLSKGKKSHKNPRNQRIFCFEIFNKQTPNIYLKMVKGASDQPTAWLAKNGGYEKNSEINIPRSANKMQQFLNTQIKCVFLLAVSIHAISSCRLTIFKASISLVHLQYVDEKTVHIQCPYSSRFFQCLSFAAMFLHTPAALAIFQTRLIYEYYEISSNVPPYYLYSIV